MLREVADPPPPGLDVQLPEVGAAHGDGASRVGRRSRAGEQGRRLAGRRWGRPGPPSRRARPSARRRRGPARPGRAARPGRRGASPAPGPGRREPASPGWRDGAGPARRRGSGSGCSGAPAAMRSMARRAAASPSVLSWNSALARRSGRNDLGGDDQHGQRRRRDGSTRRAAAAQRHRHEGHRHRCQRVEDESGEEGRRSVETLAGAAPRPPRSMRARCWALRPKARSTLSPSNTSATAGRATPPGASGRRRRGALARPTSAPNTGNRTRRRHDDRGQPVEGADHGHQGDGGGHGEHEVGDAAADVDVEGVEAPARQRGHVAARPAAAGCPAAPLTSRRRRRSALARRAPRPRRALRRGRTGPAPRPRRPARRTAGSGIGAGAAWRRPAGRRGRRPGPATVAADTRPIADRDGERAPHRGRPRSRRSTGPERPLPPPRAERAGDRGHALAPAGDGPRCRRVERAEQALAEHPVRPGLVGEDERDEAGRHDGHDDQRVVLRGGPGDGEERAARLSPGSRRGTSARRRRPWRAGWRRRVARRQPVPAPGDQEQGAGHETTASAPRARGTAPGTVPGRAGPSGSPPPRGHGKEQDGGGARGARPFRARCDSAPDVLRDRKTEP